MARPKRGAMYFDIWNISIKIYNSKLLIKKPVKAYEIKVFIREFITPYFLHVLLKTYLLFQKKEFNTLITKATVLEIK